MQQARASGLDIRVIECACRNAAAARNRGIRIATGDAIALLDADDLWLDHHLESAMALLSSSDDVAYISGFDRMFPDGAVLESVIAPLDRPSFGIDSLEYIEMLASGFTFGHLTVVYRMDRLAEVGLYDEVMLNRHDFDLWLRVVAGKSWSCDPLPTARYRVDTPGALTGNIARGNYFGLRAMVNNLPRYGSPAYRTMLRTAARRAMTTGLVNGTDEEYHLAKKLALPHLSLQDRLLFGCFGQRSGLLSKAIQFSRARRFPPQGSATTDEANVD